PAGQRNTIKIMSYRCERPIRFVTVIVLLTLPWAALPAADETKTLETQTAQAKYKRSTDPGEAAACREQLRLIHDAIRNFKTAHDRLPHWLSELSPEYLDAKLLICPYVNKIADLRSWRYGLRDDVFQDPKESTSYGYEFNEKPLILWTGLKATWNEYKHRVM